MYLLPKFQDYPPGGIHYHTVSTVFPDHSCLHLQSNFTRATQFKKKYKFPWFVTNIEFPNPWFRRHSPFSFWGSIVFFQGRKKNTKRQTSGVFQQPTIFKAPSLPNCLTLHLPALFQCASQNGFLQQLQATLLHFLKGSAWKIWRAFKWISIWFNRSIYIYTYMYIVVNNVNMLWI